MEPELTDAFPVFTFLMVIFGLIIRNPDSRVMNPVPDLSAIRAGLVGAIGALWRIGIKGAND